MKPSKSWGTFFGARTTPLTNEEIHERVKEIRRERREQDEEFYNKHRDYKGPRMSRAEIHQKVREIMAERQQQDIHFRQSFSAGAGSSG